MSVRLMFALLIVVTLMCLAFSDEPKPIVNENPSVLRYRSPTAFRFRSPSALRYRTQVQFLPNPDWCLYNCSECASKVYTPGTDRWYHFYNWCINRL
ncbi:hypothetical protein AAVH_12813 [Aphelenchoides avenae]|nr:hypothetical protein AAVH_12813 [Aphelenchus avenae]